MRIESGVRERDEISIFYDPMIAKLVVWGATREQAIRTLLISLKNYRVHHYNDFGRLLVYPTTSTSWKRFWNKKSTKHWIMILNSSIRIKFCISLYRRTTYLHWNRTTQLKTYFMALFWITSSSNPKLGSPNHWWILESTINYRIIIKFISPVIVTTKK